MKRNVTKRNIAIVILSLLLLIIGSYTAYLISMLQPNNLNEAVLESQINQIRTDKGLPVLANDRQLQAVATLRADELCTTFFSHDNFQKTLQETKYFSDKVGENLAQEFSTNEQMIEAWKVSPKHYENIVDPLFTKQAVGVVECPTGQAIAVSMFAR